jgi:hypothetical protein
MCQRVDFGSPSEFPWISLADRVNLGTIKLRAKEFMEELQASLGMSLISQFDIGYFSARGGSGIKFEGGQKYIY